MRQIRKWRLLILAGLLLCEPGCGSVRLVRGTGVAPGEASHRDDRPPVWAASHGHD